MNGPRFATAPILVKTTLTAANPNRNGTGTINQLYAVPATYDFAPPPAFAAGLGSWIVPTANQTARAQGLRVSRIGAVSTGNSGDGILCLYTGTDIYDQLKINANSSITAATPAWEDAWNFEERGGWRVPPGMTIAVSSTSVLTPIVVTMEAEIG